MSRHEKLESAIQDDKLPIYRGRAVGSPCQLARLADVPNSTVRYAFLSGNVRKYDMDGAVLFIDAMDLVEHFRTAKPGRKQLQKNRPCPDQQITGNAQNEN